MAYATTTDAIDLYGDSYVETSVPLPDTGEVDLTPLSDAFDQATSEIDSYLGTRYDVPLASVPNIVVRYCIDIAIYQASARHGAGLTDEKRRRYEDALRWLKDVASGKATLGLSDSDAGGEVQDEPETAYSTRLFSRSTLGGLF